MGYLERDPIRKDDSFLAFEEILQLACRHQVDFLLLGGDLFHDNRPSRQTLHRAISLLRKYCLGSRPLACEYLSDPQVDFPEARQINYENPHHNISLPVFSIHGNHDDPSGDGNLSSMDLLSATGLVNYFGRQSQIDDIKVSPVLLKKGSSRLALYGLGNVRDERLYRTMEHKKLTMCRPEEDAEEWFNLLVLHQNRAQHGAKNWVPEAFLSQDLDLIVWGHEHQCRVEPEFNHQKSFYVSQPGSSVATSLSVGESTAKHVALLKIHGRNFKIEKQRLRNVRPFVIADVVLAEVEELSPESSEDEVVEYLKRIVEELILKAQQNYQQQMEETQTESKLGMQPKPLIRVRVEYSGGFESFHPQRFGLMFSERVANPRDIVFFYRRKKQPAPKAQTTAVRVAGPVEDVRVESLIGEFLDQKSMQMLVGLELAEAIRLFVQKGDNEAIAQSLKQTVEYTQKHVMDSGDSVEGGIEKAQKRRWELAKQRGHGKVTHVEEETVVLNSSKKSVSVKERKAIQEFEKRAHKQEASIGSSEEEEEEEELEALTASTTVVSRPSRTARATLIAADQSEEELLPKRKRKRAAAAAAAAAKKKKVQESESSDSEVEVVEAAAETQRSGRFSLRKR